MQYKTHIAFGLATGIGALQIYSPVIDDLVLFSGGLIIGALLPDIDHMKSKIGRKLPSISKLVYFFFGHRKFFHSILFVALLWGILRDMAPYSFVLGLVIGTISHLIGDMMTPRGIKLFYPLPWNVKFPLTFKSGGLVEYLLLLLFISVIIFHLT
ncbi:metal-dependent hydrolase [Bacillus sp. FJAT-45350]|uniref:metal-dependent hydrolase n=1 Tax=Bacillus sp. FJAT-45350 TaxID=2011014 RepID=UPI000BB6EC14|nr:metal-dependent hydrolase [Bacillus sp. FJAT-45350]